MKTRILTIIISTIAFIACVDEEPIQYEDHQMKTIAADMKYNANADHFEVAYTQQNYFTFSTDSIENIGTYGSESWTDFNLDTSSENYNTETDVLNWDLLFTSYTTAIDFQGVPMEYVVCGVLTNSDQVSEVRLLIDEDALSDEERSNAFESIQIEAFDTIPGNQAMDAINYEWKTHSMTSGTYTVNSNYFYLIETTAGDFYKLRFIGFYGIALEDRIIQAQYQLL